MSMYGHIYLYMAIHSKVCILGVWTCFGVSGLVFRCLDLYSRCLDLYFVCDNFGHRGTGYAAKDDS